MDYLHGDVLPDEAEVACYYEYARESQTLRKVAKERDLLTKGGKLGCEAAVIQIYNHEPSRWPFGYSTKSVLIAIVQKIPHGSLRSI